MFVTMVVAALRPAVEVIRSRVTSIAKLARLRTAVAQVEPTALFFGALGLTAITDNAALTYLVSLIEGMIYAAKYSLVAGAVACGGLSEIANAPNPAGVSLLKREFNDESIGAGGLLLGAALPSLVAAAIFLL